MTLSASSVEVSVIAHATEDLSSVEAAASRTIPKELEGSIRFSRHYALGHHGNPITTLRLKLTKRKEVGLYLRSLASLLGEDLKGELGSTIRDRIDEEGSLFLRLDKQAALQGRTKLAQRDPIRIRIRFIGRPMNVEEIIKYCRELELMG